MKVFFFNIHSFLMKCRIGQYPYIDKIKSTGKLILVLLSTAIGIWKCGWAAPKNRRMYITGHETIRYQKTNGPFFLSDSQSLDLVNLVLPDFPLVPEHDGRNFGLCRPRVLSGLVERQQYPHILEELEFARPSLVCSPHLQTRAEKRLLGTVRSSDRFLYLGLLPWIPDFGAT